MSGAAPAPAGRRSAAAIVVAAGLALAGASRAEADRRRGRAPVLPEVPALPTPTAEGTVTIDGAAIRYVTFGRGPAVVLLHGGCGHSGQFGALVPALHDRHQVIAIDARGQGGSGLPASGLSYAALAKDVIAVLDHLQVPRAAVVGWSDGAVVGLDLAMHHGERITGLFAFAGNLDRGGTMRPRDPAPFTAYYARCARDQAQAQPDAARRAAARGALRRMWRSAPRYTAAQARAIAVPVTVVHTERDQLIRADHARKLADLIPGARLVVLRGVGHFAMFEDPPQFAAAVREFLTGLPPAP